MVFAAVPMQKATNWAAHAADDVGFDDGVHRTHSALVAKPPEQHTVIGIPATTNAVPSGDVQKDRGHETQSHREQRPHGEAQRATRVQRLVLCRAAQQDRTED